MEEGKSEREKETEKEKRPWRVKGYALTEEEQQLRPHPCNDRLEDIIQALFEDNRGKNIPMTCKLFWRCMRSNPGEEPTEPYLFVQQKPPGRRPGWN